MSTKTTFKRITLVTVAALGLGVMSVAPSSAAVQLDSVTATASATQVTTETLTATAAVVTVTLASTNTETMTVTATIQSGPAYVAPILVFKESTTANTAGTGTSVITIAGRTTSVSQATAKYSLYLDAPATAGTYVVKLTPTGGSNAVATTVSIVVSKKVYSAVSATHSRVWTMVPAADGADANVTRCNGYGTPLGICAGGYSQIYVGRDTDASKDAFNLSTVSTTLKPLGVPVASFAIIPRNESGSATTLSPSPITVSVSGPGNVAIQDAIVRAKSVTESVANSGADGYDPAKLTASAWLISDGTAGSSVVKFSMDGVVLRTVTVNQVGTTSAYVFGTPSKNVIGVGETASVTITGADSLATTTGAASVWAYSSDTAVATVGTSQTSTVVITGVKSGTATITVGNASTLAASTITKTLAVKVGAITAKTVAFTMSPTAPQPGEKVTLTVTATDASGNAVGDGSRDLFSAGGLTTSLAVQGATWTASTAAVTLKDGKAEYSFYAPTGTGKLTVTATEGASTDSTTKGSITGSVDVTNAALDAATVAAEAAEAAAQDATDAALDATTAAEAAGALAQEAVDLVTELSAQVTKLMTALKAQINYLTKLVMKLAAKK
ncbi:MAG: hypothetical protein NTV18_02990 [Actinobacteria bacterium]|nr:hypothetical protein [Actinomycetota bacterium]